jgi:hypothetical protein
MGKSDQKRIGQQAEANSKQDQANAGTAFAGVGKGITDFQSGIGNYSNWLNSTYGPGGSFMNNAGVMANDVSQANQKGFEDTVSRDAQRTGYNTANAPAVEAEAARAGARDLTSFNAKEQQLDTEQLDKGNQYVVGEEGKVPQMWEGAYGTSLGASDNSLNTAQKAENQPPWWQTALNYAAQGGADYAKMGCWIAEALWSPTDIRVFILRAWLNHSFAKSPFGSVVMWFYRTFGRQVAALARRSAMVRAILRPLFVRALNSALEEID